MKRVKDFFDSLIEKNRKHHIATHISKYFGYFWAAAKMLFGIFSGSFFFCVSAMYTLAFALTKEVFFKGRKESGGDTLKQRKYYLQMCGILALASVIYIAYMARLFFYPSNPQYGMIMGIAIATFAFTDLIIAIVNLAKKNTHRDLLVSGVKSIGLAGALLAIAFAQIAILSFTTTDTDPSQYNAIGGIVMGGGCLVICVFMLVKYFKVKPYINPGVDEFSQ